MQEGSEVGNIWWIFWYGWQVNASNGYGNKRRFTCNHASILIAETYSFPESVKNFLCAIESRDELPDLGTQKIKIMEEYDSRRQKQKEVESGSMCVCKI